MATQTLNKAVLATNGKKTTTTVILMLIVSIFGDKVPFIRDNAIAIDNIIELLLASGLLHKAWRNRKEIITFIKNKFKKQKS